MKKEERVEGVRKVKVELKGRYQDSGGYPYDYSVLDRLFLSLKVHHYLSISSFFHYFMYSSQKWHVENCDFVCFVTTC